MRAGDAGEVGGDEFSQEGEVSQEIVCFTLLLTLRSHLINVTIEWNL